MTIFSHIWAVIKYETINISKSTVFRLYVVFLALFLALVSFMLNNFELTSIVPAIPYHILYLLNLFQTLFCIFISIEVIAQDFAFDTAQTLFVRPFTNACYVIGKVTAIVLLFLAGDYSVLLYANIFLFVFRGIPPDVLNFIISPLIMAFPACLFITGFSFLCFTVIRNRALTTSLLVFLFLLTFHFRNKGLFLYDFMGFYTSWVYSGFVGFGAPGKILFYRGLFCIWGLTLTFSAIFFYFRLFQSGLVKWGSCALVLVLVTANSLLILHHVADRNNNVAQRSEMNILNKEFSSQPCAKITDYKLHVFHNRKKIDVTANIALENATQSTLDEYIFNLNPGFSIHSITQNGKELTFSREHHIVRIQPLQTLSAGERDSLEICYTGTIDEECCYPDIEETLRNQTIWHSALPFEKRFCFVTPDYVLLTAENLWYPASGVPYNAVFPNSHLKNFATYGITVKTKDGLTAISQGECHTTPEGTFVFTPEQPLSQISLIIGRYDRKTVTVDSVEYSVYYKPGHDYFTNPLSELGDNLEQVIRTHKNYIEHELNRDYPFKRFSLIEVPLQFLALKRFWTVQPETVQPEQVFLPEKGVFLGWADFGHNKSMGKWFKWQKITSPQEQQSIMLSDFIQNNFYENDNHRAYFRRYKKINEKFGFSLQKLSFVTSFEHDYNIFPEYYSFCNHIVSEENRYLDYAVGTYLRSKLNNQQESKNYELVNPILAHSTIDEALANPRNKDIAYEILQCKAKSLIQLVGGKTGYDSFETFLAEYLDDNRFKTAPEKDFVSALNREFGIEMQAELENWLNTDRLPSFIISDASYYDHENENKSHVTFTIFNPEPVSGIFSMSNSILNQNLGFYHPMRSYEEIKYFSLNGGQTKRIGVNIEKRNVKWLKINTYLSNNCPNIIFPNTITKRFSKPPETTDFESIIETLPSLNNPNEIIVDNDDPGFEIVSQPDKSVLMKLLNISNNTQDEYLEEGWLRDLPGRWLPAVDWNFYGSIKKTAYIIKSGSGKHKVTWTTEIPEKSRYDIYYFTPDVNNNFYLPYNQKLVKDLHFTIYCDDMTDEKTLDLQETKEIWSYLGTYDLPKGTSIVELSDKTDGKGIYADAVKWEKK
ncbi:MAG: hypothetical protein JXB48_01070 [Candidatus Latescibacteria bacterium]|nr:hypothetical protein [Candidatus Latescibacterota bacterium]